MINIKSFLMPMYNVNYLINSFNERLSSFETDFNDLKSKVAEIDKLLDKNTDLQAQSDKLAEEVKILKNKNDDLNTKLKSAIAQYNELEKIAKKYREEAQKWYDLTH